MNNFNIDEENKEVKVELNKDFYDIESITKGKEDYKDICEVGLEEDTNKISIKLKPKKELNLKVLGMEFCNYVLGIMKSKD
jgi:hypothetical protein